MEDAPALSRPSLPVEPVGSKGGGPGSDRIRGRNVPIGRYSLSVSIAAFETFTVNEITLAAGDRLRGNAGMVPGSVSQTFAQTDSSTVGPLADAQNLDTQTVNGFYNFKRLDETAITRSQRRAQSAQKASRPV